VTLFLRKQKLQKLLSWLIHVGCTRLQKRSGSGGVPGGALCGNAANERHRYSSSYAVENSGSGRQRHASSVHDVLATLFHSGQHRTCCQLDRANEIRRRARRPWPLSSWRQAMNEYHGAKLGSKNSTVCEYWFILQQQAVAFPMPNSHCPIRRHATIESRFVGSDGVKWIRDDTRLMPPTKKSEVWTCSECLKADSPSRSIAAILPRLAMCWPRFQLCSQ